MNKLETAQLGYDQESGSILYLIASLVASNAFAILTIRFPQNFNESKYVAFSTFSLGLMWIAFIFTYLNTADKFQTAVISFTIQMSAMSVLLCLFAPRVFIVLFLSKCKVNDADNRKNTMTGEDCKIRLQDETKSFNFFFNTRNCYY